MKWFHLAAILCSVVNPATCGPIAPACNLPTKIKEEIQSYTGIANEIFEYVLNGPYKHQTYDSLAAFVDKHIDRVSGSENLERAIDYLIDLQGKAGLENVHKENATVPVWIRYGNVGDC